MENEGNKKSIKERTKAKHKEKQSKEMNESSNKQVAALFSHLEIAKGANASLASRDIHPAVLVIGLQFADFKICGANARCIATLTAFKKVNNLRGYFY
jgi:translation initiation factor eIF-2B subunit delta